jgi:hypothetical protein
MAGFYFGRIARACKAPAESDWRFAVASERLIRPEPWAAMLHALKQAPGKRQSGS